MNFQSLHIWLDIQVGYFPLIKSMKLYGAKIVSTVALQLPV